MHLNECFALAFVQQEEHRPVFTDEDSPFRMNELSLVDFPRSPQQGYENGIASVLKCIGADWFGKSKTVFHIPKEALAGYTYLFDGESEPKKHHGFSAKGHRSPTFVVNAGHPSSNLHPHNYTTFSNGNFTPSIVHSSAWFLTDSRMMNIAPPKNLQPSLPMTTPYFHPNTDIPGEP